ncbi:MAG: AAA family ATPase [Solirubrobacterales bacterium]|nr:AAA family ATPase [Solirubrobacterales bacterium]MBV9713801.1 AAA family ATPase [Solirubrobacterales bacterium]
MRAVLPTQRVSRAGVSSPKLAGRDRELESLRAALAAAEERRPSLLLLTGDGGVGKTRLVHELQAIAEDRGACVLRGECLELSFGELPYAPIAEALRDVDEAVLESALSKLPPAARQELGHVFPDTVRGDAGVSALDDRFGQSRLFGWILALLRNLCGSSAVVLVIEDIHFADASSRDFLRFLVHNLRAERLLAIATARAGELHREHPARALVGDLVRHERVTRVELRSLSEEAVYAQVEGILGTSPTADLVRALFARTQGNPFYTEELLAAGPRDVTVLPETLRDALLLRADKLSAPAREVLRLLATAGRTVDEDVLERAAGMPRSEVESALRECIDHHVLVCDHSTGEYTVRHALAAEAVYGDLLPVERASLHRRLADALEQVARADNAADRAHHWQLAHEPALALRASIEAGLGAERVFGYSEALAHFERAVELWGQVTPGAEASPLDLVGLLARAAQAARWTGDSERARRLCQQALDCFDHAADPLRAAQLLERLGRYEPWDVDASLAAFRRALSLTPDSRPEQRMRLYVDEALALSFRGRWEQTREKATQAIALAQGEETLACESSARALLGLATAFLGDFSSGERHLRHALKLAERASVTEDLVQTHLDLGEVLRLQGRIEAALEVMSDGEPVALARGAIPYGNFMAANAADDLFQLGRWDEVQARLDDLAGRDLHRPAELLTASLAARLDAARGHLDEAAARFAAAAELCQALDLVEFVPAVYSGYAELELWRGRPEAARERIATGLSLLGTEENLLHVPVLHSTGARAEADIAETTRARHDPEAAAEAAAAVKRHHDRLTTLIAAHVMASPPPEARAHLALCAAELTRARRRPTPAAWAEAASLWQRHGNPYRVAYAAFRHAEACVHARAPRPDAQAALETATAIGGRLRAEPLQAATRSLARRARLTAEPHPEPQQGGAGAASPPEQPNPFGLTDRELEVLRLLGAGLTNREISQALFISQHTAGVHVSHILGKLGVPNRVMAAAAAERLGLGPHA